VEQKPICAKCGKPCDESNAFKNRQGQWFHNACVNEHMSDTPELGFIAKLELPQWCAKIAIGILVFSFLLDWGSPWMVKIMLGAAAGSLTHWFSILMDSTHHGGWGGGALGGDD